MDYENTMNRFELITSQTGVTDLQRFMEIKYYFAGSAGMVCALYERNPDPIEGLKETIRHLKQNYGRRTLSAQRMLDDLLQGSQIQQSNSKELQKFILSLETTYKRALETNRHATFDSTDTINQILRKRLSFATNRWSIELVKKRESWGSDDEDETEPKFQDFLSFLKRMTLIATERNTILGTKKGKEKSAEINAIDIGGGTTQVGTANQRGGHGGGRGNRGSIGGIGRGGRGGAQGGGTTTSTGAAASSTTQGANQNRGGGRGRGFRGGGGGGTVTRTTTPSNKPQGQKTTTTTPKTSSGGSGDKNDSVTWACVACHGHVFHHLESCSTFAKKAGPERFLILKTAGICLLCLRRGHIAPNCESESKCSKCSGRHHDLLHRENPKAAAPPSGSNS